MGLPGYINVSLLVCCLALHSGCHNGTKGAGSANSMSIVSLGWLSDDELSVMIVRGLNSKGLDVSRVKLLQAEATDSAGKKWPVHLHKTPGESSKWGPYVNLSFKPVDGKEPIRLKAMLEYGGSVFSVQAVFARRSEAPESDLCWEMTEGTLQRLDKPVAK